MRTLHYTGCELVTTDRVADALLDYLVTLPLNHPPERVRIPALRDGVAVVAELIVTAMSPLVATTSDERDVALDGEDYAVDVLRHRASRLGSAGLGFA